MPVEAWWGVAVLAVFIVGPAMPYLRFKFRKGLATVEEGACYRCSEMRPARMVKVCRGLGIRTVIDLRSPLDGLHDKPADWSVRKVEAERRALAEAGVDHVNVPARQVADEDMIEAFVRTVSQPAAAPFLIHCDHGIGRTGFFVAVYLMECKGYAPEAARRIVANYYSVRPRGRRHFRRGVGKGALIATYVLLRDRKRKREDER